MFRRINKNKRGQNTAEYAILIALVVAAIIAMQTYAQRTLQARVRDASLFLVNNTNGIGVSQQYEPYYLKTDYNVGRNATEGVTMTNGYAAITTTEDSMRTRASGGFSESSYNATQINDIQ